MNSTLEQEEYRVRHWTRSEYHAMAEIGLFEGQHVELLEGEIFLNCDRMGIEPEEDGDCPRRRWTRAEYHAMDELGFFQDQRVELLDGEVVVNAAQHHPHNNSITKAARVIGRAFGDGYWIRVQMALLLNANCEPEPNVSVVLGTEDDYDENPDSALLVIEVSGTTLKEDRTRKARIYAEAGIEDYWIINVFARCVEVFRRPKKTSAGKFQYDSVKIVKEGGFISPLAMLEAKIAVADLLPPERLTRK